MDQPLLQQDKQAPNVVFPKKRLTSYLSSRSDFTTGANAIIVQSTAHYIGWPKFGQKNKSFTFFVNTNASQSDQTANKQFKEKYGIGFEFNDLGLPTEDCMTIYNQTVFEYLDSRFGKQWRDEMKVNAGGFK